MYEQTGTATCGTIPQSAPSSVHTDGWSRHAEFPHPQRLAPRVQQNIRAISRTTAQLPVTAVVHATQGSQVPGEAKSMPGKQCRGTRKSRVSPQAQTEVTFPLFPFTVCAVAGMISSAWSA